ncbi:hypothetical protein PMAC_002153 [Pneumocystis sp. 'macacae']|nr:hypothetical protein PMAC_002153 [Pneumocystis sp. 'macacae']
MLPIWLIIGPKRDPSPEILVSAFSSTVGNDRNRSVWPVGAVSNTHTEYSIDFTCFMISANPIASSTPGIENAMSCIIPDTGFASPSAAPLSLSTTLPHHTLLNHLLDRRCRVDFLFSNPSTLHASFPNFCPNASDRLCAGSVEISRTDSRTRDSWIASEHDVVVFPTPPLPPVPQHCFLLPVLTHKDPLERLLLDYVFQRCWQAGRREAAGAMERPRLALARQPRGAAPATAEQRYWRGFRTHSVHREIASVSHVHVCDRDPHDVAVTSAARVQIYSLQTQSVKKTIARFRDTAYSGELRADGRLVVAGDSSGGIQVFDTETRAIVKSISGHQQAVHVTRFSPHRQTVVVSASDDKTVRLWDLAAAAETCVLEGNGDYVRAADFLGGSEVVVSGGYDGSVRLWDTRDCRREIMRLEHGEGVEAVVSLGQGSVVVSAGGPVVRVWDVVAGRAVRELRAHQKTVLCLARNREGSWVLSGALDRHIKVYDVRDWQVVHSLKYGAAVLSAAVSPDNRHIVVGLVSGELSIRSRTGEPRVSAARGKGVSASDRERREGVSGEVVEEKRKSLRAYDRALSGFRYGDALDMVVEKVGLGLGRADRQEGAGMVYTMLRELKQRLGLRQALENRDEESLEPIVRWLVRHVRSPRYVGMVVEVLMVIIDKKYTNIPEGRIRRLEKKAEHVYDNVSSHVKDAYESGKKQINDIEKSCEKKVHDWIDHVDTKMDKIKDTLKNK